MGSLGEIMQLCRLCLVKDKVNIPIFEGAGDIRKISHKISACLPVKVAKDDKLPKKICDGCSLKLDVIYQFWNTSTASEKQLLEWVNNPSSLKGESQDSRANVAEHIVLKQEIDNGDSEALDAGEFIDVNDSFENIGYTHDDDDDMSNENIAIKTENDSQSYIEPPRKKQKVVSLSSAESEEDADDPSDAYNRDDSDEEDNDISDAQPTFVNVSDADQQPGPSGVGKSSGDAPSVEEHDPFYFTFDVEDGENQILVFNLEDSQIKSENGSFTHEDHNYQEKSLEDEFGKNQYPCELCPEMFPDEIQLVKHVAGHNKYKCPLCTLSFPRITPLGLHYQDHLDSSIFTCHICEFVTAKKLSFIPHIKRHAEEELKFHCEHCGRKFLCRGNYTEHVAKHNPSSDIFPCTLCKKTFSMDKYLKSHMKWNHQKELFGTETSFPCHVCGRGFRFSNSLIRHLRVVHKVGKDFSKLCGVCGKIFQNSYYLKLHMRSHTGEKPYMCDKCGKGFSKSDKLNKHLKGGSCK